jgi:hypothetical protein
MSALASLLRKAVHAPGDGDAVAVTQQLRERRVVRERVAAGLKQQRPCQPWRLTSTVRPGPGNLPRARGWQRCVCPHRSVLPAEEERQRSSGQLITCCLAVAQNQERCRPGFAGVRASISLENKSFAPELRAAVLSSDGSNSTRSRKPVPVRGSVMRCLKPKPYWQQNRSQERKRDLQLFAAVRQISLDTKARTVEEMEEYSVECTVVLYGKVLSWRADGHPSPGARSPRIYAVRRAVRQLVHHCTALLNPRCPAAPLAEPGNNKKCCARPPAPPPARAGARRSAAR